MLFGLGVLLLRVAYPASNRRPDAEHEQSDWRLKAGIRQNARRTLPAGAAQSALDTMKSETSRA
jgi:hypothetical protein